MSPGLRHSVAIPTHPSGPETAERRNLLDLGRLVESAGFDALWVSEEAPPGLDSLVAVSALGTATSTIGLVAVVGPARRAPTVLAKSAAGADRLTGGRLELGLEAGGAGEVSEVVRASLDGMGPANLPPPLGPVPLWIVGEGSDASNAAARWGSGWMVGWNLAVARVVQAVGRLGEECHELGRDPAAVRVAAGVVCVFGEDDADAERRRRELGDLSSAPLALTVDSARQMLDDLEAAGATDVVVSSGRRPFDWHPNAGSELWATALLSVASSPEGYDGGERSGR